VVVLFVLIKKSPFIHVSQVNMPTIGRDISIIAVDLNDSSGAMPFRLVVAYRPLISPAIKMLNFSLL